MAREYTLIIIKPDGLEKSLTGSILTKLSEADFEIVASKIVRVSRELAEKHYQHLQGKPFFEDVIRYIQGEYHHRKKVMALVYMGENAIASLREIVGATNPEEARPTSIRGKFGRITSKGVYENVIHASSSIVDAEREIKLWFAPDEIIFDIYPAQQVTIKECQQRIWV
jgi:nucleoside-diphosphate kinase